MVVPITVSFCPRSCPLVNFTDPKSRSFTVSPSAPRTRNTLSGFRSRCTKPRACAESSASASCDTIRTPRCTGMVFSRVST
jgi:hypothetical protein